jgi:hypothetical protein
MIPNGIELFELRQRRSADGSVFFTGKIGSAYVVMIRDQFERDVWKVIAGDPSQTNTRDTSPARAIAAAPADEDDDDDGDHDAGDADDPFDDIPEDVMASPSQSEGR